MAAAPPPDEAPDEAPDKTAGEPAPEESAAGVAEAKALVQQGAAPDPEAFLDPLKFIRDDHFRQLRMCNLLDSLTYRLEVEPIQELASVLLRFMQRDLPLHTLDEEEDLFPALRRRCRPEDGLEDVLRQLSREHELDKDLADFVVADLEALAQGIRRGNPVRLLMNIREFAEIQKRHLGWEDRVVLPLARQRLTEEDLAGIGRGMAERRSLVYPG